MVNAEQGQRDFHALRRSRHFAWIDIATITPRDAMRLFLPPVPEDKIQMHRPIPPPFKAWCEGFAAARREHEQLQVNSPCCHTD